MCGDIAALVRLFFLSTFHPHAGQLKYLEMTKGKLSGTNIIKIAKLGTNSVAIIRKKTRRRIDKIYIMRRFENIFLFISFDPTKITPIGQKPLPNMHLI